MKISIITATYNSGSTLRDTFESILRQSYKDIEYIVIDGASKDNTLALIEEYLPKFEGRMTYFSEPDKGIYDAMNKGLQKATGDVVGLLNSDDFFTSDDVLEKVAETLQNPELDAIYGDVHYVDCSNVNKCVRYYSSKVFSPNLMLFGFMPAHPSFYCRREIYNKYGAFDTSYKVAADFEILLRFIYVNHIRTKYLPKDFVTMRTGGASNRGLASHRQINRDHMQAFKKNGVKSNMFLLSLRYIYKIGEVVVGKFRS